MIKIIIINGSQRKNGATYTILNEIRSVLSELTDVQIELYNVSEINLKYCIGCSQCYKNGKCVFDDEKECDGCMECEVCDLDPSKPCTNCGKCLDIRDYATIKIEKVISDEEGD